MKVFGKNVFNELKDNIKSIKKVYIAKNFNDKEIIKFIQDNKISYSVTDPKNMDGMVEGRHQGIIAVIDDYEYVDYKTMLGDNVVVMLDHLEDPHNFGAIIRTCEAAGIKSIIIPELIYTITLSLIIYQIAYLINEKIESRMDLVIKLISMGRNSREEAKIKVRQPISEILLDKKNKDILKELDSLIVEELNVKNITYVSDLSTYMNFTVKPNFKEVGKLFGKNIKEYTTKLLELSNEEISQYIRNISNKKVE